MSSSAVRVVRGAALVGQHVVQQATQCRFAAVITDALRFAVRGWRPLARHEAPLDDHDDLHDVAQRQRRPAPTWSAQHPPPPTMSNARERRVPASALSRAAGFGGMAASIAFGAFTELTKRMVTPTTTPKTTKHAAVLSERNFERLAAGLCRMRGAALKLGQMLSLQDDAMIAPQFAAVLERVRAGADVMPRAQVQDALAAGLGDDWRRRVHAFDEVPVAAASIGQVHFAALEDGRAVALKLQYPGVASSIRSDLHSVKRLLQLTNVFPKGLYFEEIVETAREELARECDYELEAANQMKFRELIADDDDFFVPAVIPELSTKRILCTEFVDGVALSELVHFSQDCRNDVAARLLKLCMRELFEFKFMQTDPNWANFLYNAKSNVISLIDFGAARSFGDDFVSKYLRMVIACAKRDREKIVEISTSLGFLTGSESKEMLEAHVQSALVVGEPFATRGKYDFAKSGITSRLSDLASTMLQHRLTPPPVEAYTLHRKLAGLYLTCIKLNAVIECRPALEHVVSTNYPQLLDEFRAET